MNIGPLAGVASVVDAVGRGLDGLLTSDEERLRGERDLAEVADRPHADQRATNLAEAQHRSVWVAGWRPGIGWCCAAGIGYHFLARPLLAWAGGVFGLNIPDPPPIDIDALMSLVLALLGLGGLRTFEKLKGLTR